MYVSVAHYDFDLGEDRREHKGLSGEREDGKCKITKKNNTEIKEMDCVKPTKKWGRVTTQKSECLGDLFLQFVPSPPIFSGK